MLTPAASQPQPGKHGAPREPDDPGSRGAPKLRLVTGESRAGTRPGASGQVEPIEIHDLAPCGSEVAHELLL